MTTQTAPSHPKHKKYRLEAFEDDYCWVEDLRTGTSHQCFPLDHEIGDEVWLFEKSFNIYNGHISFRYSVLNLYEVGEVYDFDVIREGEKHFMVSNYEHLRFPAPISCRTVGNPKTEKLLVANLDLDSNKPVFASPYALTGASVDFSEMDFSIFEEGVVYELPVLEKYINKNGNPFVIAVYKGLNYHISVPAKYADLDFTGTVECQLGYYAEGGRYTLKITRHCFVSKLYKEGEKYPFRIKKFLQDKDQAGLSWLVEDKYGYTNMYHPDNDFSFRDTGKVFKEDDIVELFVWKITKRGYLTLVTALTNVKQSKYVVEDVFKIIGFEGQETEYFYNLDDRPSGETDSDTEESQSYMSQYLEGENLWILSYFSFLDEKIVQELEDGEYVRAKTLLEIYISLEKWLIYSSDYLQNFLPYKASAIIEKAEGKIASLEGKIQAIDLFLNDEDQKFFESVKQQLINTRHLQKNKIITLKELIRISEFFVGESDADLLSDTIMLLLKNNLLSDWDRYQISKIIENKIIAERERIIDVYQDENNVENRSELPTLLVYQNLLLFLITGEDNNMRLKFASVNLLRSLSVYHSDKSYLKIAIKLVVKDGLLKTNLSKHSNVFQLTPSDFEEMSVFPDDINSFYRDKGRVVRNDKGLTLIPKNHLAKNQEGEAAVVTVLPEHDIYVSSFFYDSEISSTNELGDLLQNVLSVLQYERINPEVKLGDYEDSHIFTGRIKAIGENKSYCFLRAKLDKDIISPLLHINSFNKCRFFGDINAYLKLNDKIAFNILKIEGTHIHISPAILLKNYADQVLEDKVLAKGIIVGKFHSKCLLITEEGWPLIVYSPSFEVGNVIKATVYEYDSNENAFLGIDAEQISENFEGEPAELYRSYLANAGMIVGKSSKSKESNETENLKFDTDFRLTSVLLLDCLDQYRKFIDDEKENIIYFFVLAVLSSIVKHSKSYYYTGKLESLAQIYKVEKAESINDIVSTESDDIENLGLTEIKEDVLAFKLLQFFATDVIDIPIPLESSSRFYKLKKLIEANNLLQSSDDNKVWSPYFKNLVIKELYAVALDKEISPVKEIISLTLDSDFSFGEENKKPSTNLGSESKTREFKSSIFYSASDEPQENVILRTISGFLNGYDTASLFIGVNDSGEVIGLKNDLQFNSHIKNLDQYQNYIQTLVVNAFPKEVNQHLDYVFHKVNNLDYLEIIIPKYDKPVSFNNEFFQRQGVQTRILKGDDLTDFMFRKATNNSAPKQIKDEEGTVSQNMMIKELKDNSSDLPASQDRQLNFDFYADQKKAGDIILEDAYPIESELLAYLYIFEDHSYILSLSDREDYLFKIPITEKFRFGYLLMCYDNACVNKVEIRSILGKTLNKRYLNGVSSYGKLMSVLLAKKDSEVIITVARNGHQYIKIMNVNRISTHRILGLKGNCIVQEDIDQVLNYWSNPVLPADFDPFRRDSKQGLGADASKFGRMYKILTKYLDA